MVDVIWWALVAFGFVVFLILVAMAITFVKTFSSRGDSERPDLPENHG